MKRFTNRQVDDFGDSVFALIGLLFCAITFLLFVGFLCGCASYPQAEPSVPGYGVISEDVTGFTFSNDKKVIWTRHGVPESFFTPSGDAWHISNEYFSEGTSIIDKGRNQP